MIVIVCLCVHERTKERSIDEAGVVRTLAIMDHCPRLATGGGHQSESMVDDNGLHLLYSLLSHCDVSSLLASHHQSRLIDDDNRFGGLLSLSYVV